MPVVYWHIFVTLVSDSELDRDGGTVKRDECIASYCPKLRRLNSDNLLMSDRLSNRLATGLLTSSEATNLVVGCPASDGGVELGIDFGQCWCV